MFEGDKERLENETKKLLLATKCTNYRIELQDVFWPDFPSARAGFWNHGWNDGAAIDESGPPDLFVVTLKDLWPSQVIWNVTVIPIFERKQSYDSAAFAASLNGRLG